jgi:hypothetical protein
MRSKNILVDVVSKVVEAFKRVFLTTTPNNIAQSPTEVTPEKEVKHSTARMSIIFSGDSEKAKQDLKNTINESKESEHFTSPIHANFNTSKIKRAESAEGNTIEKPSIK